MPQNQNQRDLVAKMKLIPNKSIIKDKCGIFLDDSIVRGTQMRDKVRDLHDAGIKEIHMRVACPPLTYPCEFLNFSRSRSSLDLATHKAMHELEGDGEIDYKAYSDSNSDKYKAMVEKIRENLDWTPCTSNPGRPGESHRPTRKNCAPTVGMVQVIFDNMPNYEATY